MDIGKVWRTPAGHAQRIGEQPADGSALDVCAFALRSRCCLVATAWLILQRVLIVLGLILNGKKSFS